MSRRIMLHQILLQFFYHEFSITLKSLNEIKQHYLLIKMISEKINIFPVQLNNNILIKSYIDQLFGKQQDEKVVLEIYHKLRPQKINMQFLQKIMQQKQSFTKKQIIQILIRTLKLLCNQQIYDENSLTLGEQVILYWSEQTLLNPQIIDEYSQLQKDTLFSEVVEKELAQIFLFIEGYFYMNNIDIVCAFDSQIDSNLWLSVENDNQDISEIEDSDINLTSQQNHYQSNQQEDLLETFLTFSLTDDEMQRLMLKPQRLSEYL